MISFIEALSILHHPYPSPLPHAGEGVRQSQLYTMTPHHTPTTPEKYWDDAVDGDTCTSPSYTVTEARINQYAELTGDFTPVHIDEAYAKTTPFGTRVAHGLFGLSIADGLKTQSDYRFVPGMSLGWSWDFVRQSKSRPGWGIVVLPSELVNQHGQVVQKGEHRLMIPLRSA
jgi:acyl dehydratase